MQPKDAQPPSTPTLTPNQPQPKPAQSSPNRQIAGFKSAFFNLLATNKSQSEIQDLLITNRKMLNQKVILHLYAAQPKIYAQFKYLLLGLALCFDRKQEFNLRWGTFYQIVNEILKIPDLQRNLTKIQHHVISFALFLINNTMVFFQDFPSARKLIQTWPYQNIINKNQDGEDGHNLLVKRMVRVFNSLLCLKFVKLDHFILLLYCFAVKVQDYIQFLISVQQKFVKRLLEFENDIKQKQKYENQNEDNITILNLRQIYNLLLIFYDMDPEDKLKQLIKTQLKQSPQLLGKPQQGMKFKELKIESLQINHKKSKNAKHLSVHYDDVMKMVLKQIIKNKQIESKIKTMFIEECFNQIRQIDQELFEYLLEAQGYEEDTCVSDTIIKTIQREALRFITVSRLKAILKRINLAKGLSYALNLKKMFKILRLIYWISKKFNESNPTYMLNLNSSLKLQNIQKAMMVIFSVDFAVPQVGGLIQFQVNKSIYDILIKYTENDQLCGIQVIIQVDGIQKLKQKKQINRWSYILCMVGLIQKKTIGIFIDGAYFKIPIKDSASQISKIQFGPFSGMLKNVYILNKAYQMGEIHKGYFQRFRKINTLLQQMGEKSFIFSFEKGKIAQKSSWFWKKQMSVQFKNIEKLRAISFGQGIQQLGGFPALLFLVSRTINAQRNEQQVNFLIDFFQFLKVFVNESQLKLTQKWMLNSTIYFGQFLWLILCRNQYLRSQKQLFNRIFDFFGWFFRSSTTQTNLSLRISILENIYLNFQIWSKCSVHIKLMLFSQLSTKMDQSVIISIFNNKNYEKVMSSIVFFFLDQNPDESPEPPLYISGIKVSPVHDQISKLGYKILELYGKQKLNINYDYIKKDLNSVISLMSSFFFKKHLYFSQSQLSALAVLISHYLKYFMGSHLFQKTIQCQVKIFNQLTILLSQSPQHSELIYLLFELNLVLATDLQYAKTGIALIIDNFTMFGKRAEDSLQFSFKSTIFIIRNSKVLYQSSCIFDLEKVLSTLMGSLRKKANDYKKLTCQQVIRQFDKMQVHKLISILSLTQFCMVVKQCIIETEILPTAVFFLKLIIQNDIVGQAKNLTKDCIKIIYDFVQKQKKQLQNNKLFSNASQFVIFQPEQKKQKYSENRIKAEHQYNQQEQKENIMKQKQEENMIKAEQKMAQSNQNLANMNKSDENYQEQMEILKSVFKGNDLENLLKNSNLQQVITMLVQLEVINSAQSKFVLPFNCNSYQNSVKKYGGNLLQVLKNQRLTMNQIRILINFLEKSKKQTQKSKPQMQQSTLVKIKDLLLIISPIILLYQTLIILQQINSQADIKSHIVNNQTNTVVSLLNRCLELADFTQIFAFQASIQGHKKFIHQLNRKLNQNANRKNQLSDLSGRLVNQYQVGKTVSVPLQKILRQLKDRLSKNKIQSLNDSKQLKKIIEQIKQLVQSYFLVFNIFSKKPTKPASNKNQLCIQGIRAKKLDSKRRKLLENSEEVNTQKYTQQLKNALKETCSKLQSESKRKQQIWKSLAEKNKFWVSTKIKNNQCYEIHPKTTGFYRLNIIKTTFDEVPYPRRKSFEHEIEDQNQFEAQSQTKISQSELMKTLNLPQVERKKMSELTNQRSTSSDLLTAISHVSLISQKSPKNVFFVQYVTQKGVYAGNLFYSSENHGFVFKSKGYSNLPSDDVVYRCSTIFHRIQDPEFSIVIQTNSKSQIHARRYIHRHTAIEIFSHQKSFFFNLFFKDVREKFFKSFSSKITCISDLRSQFQKRKYTQKWLNGQIDNFEYLMTVNLFSGRTVNDLAQYPVMPWVITNYDEKQCQINKEFMKDPKNLRDLSKPSGKLNQKKFLNLKMRCQEIGIEDQESKFLYGTMYSNPTVIYNFFIRLEPFTTLHWEHQGRRIDHADRLFSAVRDQFNTVITSTSDNKQLVPEFYYWPEFLRNRNKVNLGIKQNKQQVHDVKLPGWAKNPQQFIFKMRQILQSGQVSKNLHNWIDLIFGYKNPKQVALQYDNLFHYRTYQHDIFATEESEHQIKGAQITISQFGQIPVPIFLKPHPEKTMVYSQNFKLDTFVILKKPTGKKIIQFGYVDQGFIIGYQNEIQFHVQQARKSLESNLEKPTKSYTSQGNIMKFIDFHNQIWVTLKDGVFRIFDKKQCMLESDVEMQCFSTFGRYIIYGFRSELVIARIQNNFKLSKFNSFYGHKSNINKINVSVMLDIIISVDESGLVLVHQFSKQKLLRQFQLGEKLTVTDLCIHQMGYFIFFTKNQKLIIYTFLGQLFFNQDIGISGKAIPESITKVSIFQQNRSLLLISTDKGKIFIVDFLLIKRFNSSNMYKQFSRFKTNLLQNCPKLGSICAIKDFAIRRVPGNNSLTYKFYILLDNNSILMYYSSQQIQQKIKTNKIFNQLGLFQSRSPRNVEKKQQINVIKQ